ncbi:helix-turn-helix domain-containing protein [Ktedonospora formicarum]|uniref:AraC family transcriptional regulator n=1 Tax=Ktedonospora formicarum TaxID=2778364 RepID=A0A8J3IBU5_9CHLR|nr:helix-turn-helix domain-containing protein [Ktedonospora formicarum]GHO48504.1 AraC family transcriptional regulator [Ktedonospora formicarum]
MAVSSRFLPSPLLAAYVEAFSISEGETELPTRERCLPNGLMAMVINLGHDTLAVSTPRHGDQFESFHGGVLHGAFSQVAVIDTATLVTTISVCFKPGGARPFLPMPATELTNQAVDLSHVFGPAALELRECLLRVQTNTERIQILERFLLGRIAWEQTRPSAVTFALASFQTELKGRPISEVTARLGVSHKRFISLFEEAVGLTPKVFCRLLRFQEALQRTPKRPPVQWTDLALSCGYFDQAHFIHDFQAFTGMSPSVYLAQRSEHHNHVPLP